MAKLPSVNLEQSPLETLGFNQFHLRLGQPILLHTQTRLDVLRSAQEIGPGKFLFQRGDGFFHLLDKLDPHNSRQIGMDRRAALH